MPVDLRRYGPAVDEERIWRGLDRTWRVLHRIQAWIGVVGHLVLLAWYLLAVYVAPLWSVGLLVAVWVALCVPAVRLWRTRPGALMWLPFLDVLVWIGYAAIGDAVGWV